MNNFAEEFAKLYCHWRPAARVFGYHGFTLLAGGHKRAQAVKDDRLDSHPAGDFMKEVTPKPKSLLANDDDEEEEEEEEIIFHEPVWRYPGQR